MPFRFLLKTVALGLFTVAAAASIPAQTPQARILGTIDNARRVTLAGSHPASARPANDAGRLSSATEIKGASIVFSRSDAQEASLQALLAAQQDPASPLYHQWLTPGQFAATYGMSDADIDKTRTWLEEQGFTVNGVSRSRNRITFSGTAAQIEAAFNTELHNYTTADGTHYAPSTDLSIPTALAGVVQGVMNLSSFRPRPHLKIKARPAFTSNQSGSHFLTPLDVATIYDVKPAYSAGYTGTGQSIAIVGQSAVVTTDITNFQTATGLSTKAPNLVLMPGTGTSTIYTGDEAESDLDLEYSGAIAKGATLYFVYTGNNSNYGVFDALEYAIDERVAPIVSVSYGDCETNLGSSNYASVNAVLAQASAQGQTIISAAGDDGTTDCYQDTTLTAAQQTAASVDFPSDSQYVTGLGGTEFPAADVASTNSTYWTTASGSDVIGSAISYIPEQVWNDDTSSAPSAGGGGVSVFTARPSWQAGVTGISSGSYRLTPDISLASSPGYPGYLYCSSDSTYTGITGSCANGFRDANNTYLTSAGGTSFAAPIFAGMLAIINQARNSTGQGNINPTLYSLASNATTYASAFHDIASGTNGCSASYTYCSATAAAGYSATTGYDSASGLGSIDLYKLLTAWPTTTASALTASTTTVTAATTAPVSGATDVITFTVASGLSTLSTTPTGTLTVVVDGTTVSSTLALTNGSATYSFSSATAGTHVITATYSGDATYAPSNGSLAVTVGASASAPAFTAAATSVTIKAGASGTSTVTVTPVNGYTGTIAWTLSSSTAISNACYAIANTAVTGTSPVTATLTIGTGSTICATINTKAGSPVANVRTLGHAALDPALNPRSTPSPLRSPALPAGIALAGLVAVGTFKRSSRKTYSRKTYSRKTWGLLSLCMLGVLGIGLSGCSNAGSSTSTTTTTTSSNTATGTYTLTLTGKDTTNTTITASATLTLTVQ
jgi:subtilase family serine protease